MLPLTFLVFSIICREDEWHVEYENEASFPIGLLVSVVSKVCIFVLDVFLSSEEEGDRPVLCDSVITGIDWLEADIIVNAAIIPKQPLHVFQPVGETCSIYHNSDSQCPVFHNYQTI